MLWKETKIKSEPPDLWIWRLAQCCHLTIRESKSTAAPTVVSAPPLRYDTQTFAAGSGFESRAAPGTVVCKELTSWQPSNQRQKELIWSFFNFILINWEGFIWDIKYMKIHFFLFFNWLSTGLRCKAVRSNPKPGIKYYLLWTPVQKHKHYSFFIFRTTIWTKAKIAHRHGIYMFFEVRLS